MNYKTGDTTTRSLDSDDSPSLDDVNPDVVPYRG